MHDAQGDRLFAYFDAAAAGYAGWDRWPLSVVRAREVATVLAHLGPITGARVLELGCGAGRVTAALVHAGAAEVVAVDRVPAMTQHLPGARVVPVVADAATLSLPDRFLHLVSAGMLEFVPDPLAVLRNAALHAQPDARFVVLVPHDGVLGRAYRAWHARHGLNIHLFDERGLAAAAERTGWELTEERRIAPFSLVATLVRTESAA